MELRPLGRTGVQVSSLCLGCMMFGGRTTPEESANIIDRALDAGINFLDTANVYNAGRSEEATGAALKANGKRHRVVLATNGRTSMRELLARVKVLFRRAAIDQSATQRPAADAPLRYGDLELDLQRYSVRWKGTAVNLTVTEFMMLHALVRYPGHVKTRKQLHQDGYPHDAYVSDRTIDSHIKRVRRKFEEVDPAFDRVDTVYGLGYRWKE